MPRDSRVSMRVFASEQLRIDKIEVLGMVTTVVMYCPRINV